MKKEERNKQGKKIKRTHDENRKEKKLILKKNIRHIIKEIQSIKEDKKIEKV